MRAVTPPDYGDDMDIIFTIAVWALLGWGVSHWLPALTRDPEDIVG